jgi:L-asparaginase/Glu-tRNA(Gln) amidotransferase subunit D
MLAPGTIQTYPADRLNYQRYKGAPELSGEEMLQKIPEVTRFARVSVDSQGSWEYDTPEQLRALTMRINEILARPDVDGLVLAHGTNEIEETAYWLDPDRIQQMFDEY